MEASLDNVSGSDAPRATSRKLILLLKGGIFQ